MRRLLVTVLAALVVAGVGARAAEASPQSSKNVAIINGGGASSAGTLPTSGTVAGTAADDFTTFNFTTLGGDAIDTATLAAYDTVVLNQVFTSDLSAAQEKVLSDFVVAGGKLVIHDADGTTGNDYSWLPVPAHTGESCQNCGKTNGSVVVAEQANNLVSGDPASPYYVDLSELPGNTDAAGDANVIKTQDPRWNIDMAVTNDNDVGGHVGGYATDGGLIIFNGLDTDQIGSPEPSGHDWLAKLWYQELALPWDPDTLPHSNPAVGPGICGGESVVVGVVTVCANSITGAGGGASTQLEATGGVTLDGGVTVGDGPIEIDTATNTITTQSPAAVAVSRPSGPVALGSFGFTIAGAATTDPTSGLTNLARVTVNSVSFGPLGALRVGGLPFSLPGVDGTALYLDAQKGGGLVGTAQISLPLFGGLAPAGSGTIGFYSTTGRPVILLGGKLTLGKVQFGGGWSFDGLVLTYQEPTDTWTASGGLTVPLASLQASGSVVGGRLDSISLNVGGQTVPLADSGFFFTDFGGSADGLASGPLRLSASTAGFWGAPKAPVEPFYLDSAKLTVDFSGSATIDGAVSFVLKDKSPVSGTLHLKLGVNPFVATGNVVVDGKLPTIKLHVAAGAGFTARHFTLDGKGTLSVDNLTGSGEEVLSDAGLGASGQLCFHTIVHTFCQQMGFALTWTQAHALLGGDLRPLGSVFGADPQRLITVKTSAAGSSSAVTVPAGRSLLALTFTDPTGPPEVALVDPHGNTYSSAKPPGNMLVGRQPEFNLTSVTILHPVAGTWHVRSTSSGPVQLAAQTIRPLKLIRTFPVRPATSSRHPLTAGKVVTLRWSSTGLPAGVQVAILDSPHPGQISTGRLLATLAGGSGSLRVGTGRLTAGGNYFALVARAGGVTFQRIAFSGSAWRR